MINRNNWQVVKAFLQFRREIEQISEATARLDECRLRHLLLWANDKPFSAVEKIRPPFAEYLRSARLDGKDRPLSPAYTRKVVRTAKYFLRWLRTHRHGYRSISEAWLESLRPPRELGVQKAHKAVTLAEVQAMAGAPANELWEKRIQAAAVFLFLSGMRVGAFVSLPLSAVDIERRTIRQWPELGMRTKFGKHATTYLLDVPEFMPVVEAWDNLTRSELTGDGYWFAPLESLQGGIDTGGATIGRHRHVRVRKDFRRWLEAVNLPYRSPHQFRHGHAVYALKQAQDIADLKAVSMNLMHANLSITDGVYGVMSDQDISRRIGGLGKASPDRDHARAGELESRLARLERILDSR